MEFCRDCNTTFDRDQQCPTCHPDQPSPDMMIFLTVLETMSEKVKLYTDIMQNRLIMVREDIVASVLEETMKFQTNMIRGIWSMRNFIAYVEGSENFPRSEDDLLPIQAFYNPEESMKLFGIEPLQFNLNSEDLQEGFSRALNGEYILFRELIRKTE